VATPNNRTAVPGAVGALLTWWHRAECWLAVACFVFISSLLVLDVLAREVYSPLANALGSGGGGGLFGAHKLAIFALVIGSFAAIGVATATGSHLVPRVGYHWLPSAWSPVIDRLADVITGAVLLVAAWYGVQFVLATKEYGLVAPVIDTSPWMIQLAIPLGFVSAAGRYFIFALWPGAKPIPPEFKE
jgi:TRAP-type C4-dicarboxylate transport system permease small subunit